MAHRVVKDLVYAAPCLRPSYIPAPRAAHGSKGAGLRFERALARAIPRAIHGQWFHFIDANGPGHCSPDLLLVGAKRVVVVECKLSNVLEGQSQIFQLYLPVLRKHYAREVLGIVAARHLPLGFPLDLVHDRFETAVGAAAIDETIPVFHWLGRGKV